MPSLKSPRLPPLDELLLPALNAIDQSAHPFVLVLDDYHLIHEQSIHAALLFLLERCPKALHLVIASRADPPLRLARLRARSELVELRLSDLCFSLEETDQLLNQAMKLALDPENVAVLTNRTEGWAAGLQMAALSLKGQEDKSAFIRSFSGSNRYILDYLVEEILLRQPEDIQAFLLKTSILERLCGPLCDGLIENKNESRESRAESRDYSRLSILDSHSSAQEILEYLDRTNLFIQPLDGERLWFRYHQLFLDLLRKRLQKTAPEEIAGLHRSASRWYEAEGFPAEAIEHAFAAGDLDRAAGLIERAAEPALMRGESSTLSGWVSRLPAEQIRARPNLALCHAWLLLMSNLSVEAAEETLKAVPPQAGSLQAKADLIRAYLNILRGDLAGSIVLARQAAEQLPEDTYFHSIASWLLSYSHVAAGDFTSGHQSLEAIVQTSLQKGNDAVAAIALCQLAEVHIRQAQLRDARRDYERALELGKRGREWLPFAAQALIGMGNIMLEVNDLDSAARHIEEGIRLAGNTSAGALFSGNIALARTREAQGDRPAADQAIDRALRLAQQTKGAVLDDLVVMALRTQMLIGRGALDEAARWVCERSLDGALHPEELDNPDDFLTYRMRKYEWLVLARYRIACGDLPKALWVLNEIGIRMEAQNRRRLALEADLLAALAHWKVGEVPNALSSLEKALEIGGPEGYIRLFLGEGAEMAHLLHAAERHGIAPAHTRRLLDAFGQGDPLAIPHRPDRLPRSGALAEPLTERELELLRLLAEGLTNQEIAGRLFISLPTVKWHTTHIYGKLGAQNRTQAVAKARAAGILPSG